ENRPCRQPPEFLIQTRLDRLILFDPAFTFIPGLQSDEKESVVTGPDGTEQAEADDTCGVLDTRSVRENCLHLSRRSACAFLRGRIGKLHVDVEVPLIFIRQKAGGHPTAEEDSARAASYQEHQHHRALPKQHARPADVSSRGAFEYAIEPVEKPLQQPMT